MRLALPAIVVAAFVPMAGAADAARGKQIFEQCAACHSLVAGKQELGPSLAGVMGRPAGSLEDFRYSPPMKRSGITWTRETIAAFLADPQKEVRGNRMPFSGLPEPADREDLLEFLLQAAR